MKTAKIVSGKVFGSSFVSSIENTSLSQRETLEQILINLATCLEIEEIWKLQGARGGYYYAPQYTSGGCLYQSASNTILEMSQQLLKRHTNP